MNCYANAQIHFQKRTRDFTYRQIPVLTAEAEFPYYTMKISGAQARINGRIRSQIAAFFQNARALYRQAVVEYQEALKNNYPFRPFQSLLRYEVTYNANCYASQYRDYYQYTGGAHGNTVRRSDTFSLHTGSALPLSYFFPAGTDLAETLLPLIIEQAEKNMADNPDIYFEDYKKLMRKNFHADQYYLSPEGLSMYYQQYDIAPYAAGIIVFTLPYRQLGWRPQCRLK